MLVALCAVVALSLPGAVSLDVEGRGARSGGRARVQRIEPKLDPKSDKEFFKRDYPDDLKPQPPRDFSFKAPYPKVQEENHFDTDYARDENGDGGEWEAQISYDKIKSDIPKKRQAIAEAEKTENETLVELNEVRKKQEAAQAAANEAQAAADEATEKARKAAEKEENTSAALASAQEEVSKEGTDLKGCQRELDEAKEKLKKLQEEKAARERAQADAEKKEVEAASKQDSKEKAEEAAEASAVQKEEDRERALKSYKEEKAELAATEAELKRAEQRLRAARTQKVEHHEAVPIHKDVQSGAARSSVAVILLLATVLVSVEA